MRTKGKGVKAVNIETAKVLFNGAIGPHVYDVWLDLSGLSREELLAMAARSAMIGPVRDAYEKGIYRPADGQTINVRTLIEEVKASRVAPGLKRLEEALRRAGLDQETINKVKEALT